MKYLFMIYLPTLLLCFASGCSKEPSKVENEPVDDIAMNKESAASADIIFTRAEEAYLNSLRIKGVLKIASQINPLSYFPQQDGSIKGFHYTLAKSFADFIGVRLEVKVVKFKDYFSLDGEIPKEAVSDPSFVYTPNLIREVDIYAANLTALLWRKKILNMIDVFPTRLLLITKKGEGIHELKELNGKRVATVFGSSYHRAFEKLEKEHNIHIVYISVDNPINIIQPLMENKADVTAQDANSAIFDIKTHKNMTVSMPISEMQMLAWSVRKDNKLLTSILEKYIQHTKATGIINELWRECYGISMQDYYNILEYQKE